MSAAVASSEGIDDFGVSDMAMLWCEPDNMTFLEAYLFISSFLFFLISLNKDIDPSTSTLSTEIVLFCSEVA